jgi:hypothetical protein
MVNIRFEQKYMGCALAWGGLVCGHAFLVPVTHFMMGSASWGTLIVLVAGERGKCTLFCTSPLSDHLPPVCLHLQYNSPSPLPELYEFVWMRTNYCRCMGLSRTK